LTGGLTGTLGSIEPARDAELQLKAGSRNHVL
jgi:hypothetical protein